MFILLEIQNHFRAQGIHSRRIEEEKGGQVRTSEGRLPQDWQPCPRG